MLSPALFCPPEQSEKQFVQAELKWKIEKPKRGTTEWVRDGVYNTDEWKPITEGILVSKGFNTVHE